MKYSELNNSEMNYSEVNKSRWVFCSQVEFLLSGRGPKGVSKEGCGKLGVSGIEK